MAGDANLEDGTETLSWKVSGMDCGACVAKVEKAVRRLPGISGVQVNLMSETMILARAPDGASADVVERQVVALGYKVSRAVPQAVELPVPAAGHGGGCCGHSDHPGHDHAAEPAAHTHGHDEASTVRLVVANRQGAAGPGALAVLVGRGVRDCPSPSRSRPTGFSLVATVAAVPCPSVRRAIALARAGTPFSIETLMCVAALGAVAIGAAHEAADGGAPLRAWARCWRSVAAGRARAGIRALAGLLPRTARREGMGGGTVEEVAADRLAVGDMVQVRPGDRVPCDGEIVAGHIRPGRESGHRRERARWRAAPATAVLAGSVNADAGLLSVRTTRAASDNTVARIVKLVEQAAASRAPTQRFVERFAEWWTPAAMVAAILVVLVPPLLFGGDWWTWTYRGLGACCSSPARARS